jgi:hypothetical protein
MEIVRKEKIYNDEKVTEINFEKNFLINSDLSELPQNKKYF